VAINFVSCTGFGIKMSGLWTFEMGNAELFYCGYICQNDNE